MPQFTPPYRRCFQRCYMNEAEWADICYLTSLTGSPCARRRHSGLDEIQNAISLLCSPTYIDSSHELL